MCVAVCVAVCVSACFLHCAALQGHWDLEEGVLTSARTRVCVCACMNVCGRNCWKKDMFEKRKCLRKGNVLCLSLDETFGKLDA